MPPERAQTLLADIVASKNNGDPAAIWVSVAHIVGVASTGSWPDGTDPQEIAVTRRWDWLSRYVFPITAGFVTAAMTLLPWPMGVVGVSSIVAVLCWIIMND